MDNVNCGVKIDIEYRFVRNFFFSLVLFETFRYYSQHYRFSIR